MSRRLCEIGYWELEKVKAIRKGKLLKEDGLGI